MGNAPTGGEGPGQRDETPAEHLDGLLARARNALHLEEALVLRLRTALLHYSEPQAIRGRRGPARPLRCRLLKHAYLLADGSSQVLWELEHNTGTDDRMLYEVYADRSTLAQAELRLAKWFGATRLLGSSPTFDPLGSGFEEGVVFDAGFLGAEFDCGQGDEAMGLPGMQIVFAIGAADGSRTYTQDHSAEHARRVLRRSENEDRPGEEAQRLLNSALAHDTTFVTRHRDQVGDRMVEWSLFEHAFLLAGGDEISLWELEHNLAPDGRLVCEVYLGEEAARGSMGRRRPPG